MIVVSDTTPLNYLVLIEAIGVLPMLFDEVLIDERRGTNVALREGLVPVPTLAVLERAAKDNVLELQIALARLQQTNFRMPPELVQAALVRDAARKRQA